VVGEIGGVALVDDYGHHPAEIEATLSAARQAYSGRVLVAFQPHRYTRTQLLFEDFTRAFNDADDLVVADVYAAGEPFIPGATGEALAQAIARHGHRRVRYAADREAIVGHLAESARAGDVVIALGAGDINRLLPDVRRAIGVRLGSQRGEEPG